MTTISADRNCARDNGTLININVVINNYKSKSSESLIESSVATFDKSNPIPPEVKQHLEKDFFRDEIGATLNSPPAPEPTPRSNGRYCFLKDNGFATCCFFQNHDNLLDEWPSPTDTKYIMEILGDEDKDKIREWIISSASNVLFFNISGDIRERWRWTTDFALELIGRVDRSNHKKGSTQKANPVLAHFCDKRTILEQWRRDAIHDLLAQLRLARKDHYNDHICTTSTNCKDYNDYFHLQPELSKDFWFLLTQCVRDAGIKSLYIILDNIDSIHDSIHNQKDAAIFKTFLENLHGLLWSSQNKSVPVKLLVTSRSEETVNHLRKLNESFRRLPDDSTYFKDALEINLDLPPDCRHRN
ncbi:hypothetical protein E8E14_009880 [Neopestalotiopsis sp. 37M]|nr:hypothetical protein E8E14_009880 [Neopestalotiopsis sp. 37M]